MFAATRERDIGRLKDGPTSFRSQVLGSLNLVGRLERTNTLEGHSGCVNTVGFSDCGDLLISGSDDKRIILWNTHTGTTLTCHKSVVCPAELTKDVCAHIMC